MIVIKIVVVKLHEKISISFALILLILGRKEVSKLKLLLKSKRQHKAGSFTVPSNG